jgi:hypothetical protein
MYSFSDTILRLADFIVRDMERILAKWEQFAETRLPAAEAMGPLELRDQAQQILEAIAEDLGTTQSPEQQAAKSMGLAPASGGAVQVRVLGEETELQLDVSNSGSPICVETWRSCLSRSNAAWTKARMLGWALVSTLFARSQRGMGAPLMCDPT